MTIDSRPRQRWLWAGIGLAALASALALIGLHNEVAAGATAGASKAGKVSVVDFAYRPATLKVAKGSQVVFTNAGDLTHTATRAKGFDSGDIDPGESASIRFAKPGTFAYHCTLHPFMRGKVIVE